MTKVRQGASRILIYEEMAPNDTWCIMSQSPDDVPSGRHAINMKDAYRSNPNAPGFYSEARGNFGFFDGHVETLAPSQILPPKGKPGYHFPLIPGDKTTF
jgi:prepilin-type processing-associated H-X9-DG protein